MSSNHRSPWKEWNQQKTHEEARVGCVHLGLPAGNTGSSGRTVPALLGMRGCCRDRDRDMGGPFPVQVCPSQRTWGDGRELGAVTPLAWG